MNKLHYKIRAVRKFQLGVMNRSFFIFKSDGNFGLAYKFMEVYLLKISSPKLYKEK